MVGRRSLSRTRRRGRLPTRPNSARRSPPRLRRRDRASRLGSHLHIVPYPADDAAPRKAKAAPEGRLLANARRERRLPSYDRVRRSEHAGVMDWLYFTVTNSDGSTRLVVRRNGPKIQLLTPNGWIDRPQLFTRFHDPGFLEGVTFEEALAAAESLGVLMPA